jgi:hypothetical protein
MGVVKVKKRATYVVNSNSSLHEEILQISGSRCMGCNFGATKVKANGLYLRATFSGFWSVQKVLTRCEPNHIAGGSDVQDTSRWRAWHSDTDSATTNLRLYMKSVLAYGDISGGSSSQADERIYTASLLPDDIVHLSIPSHLWWRMRWKKACRIYLRPRQTPLGGNRSGSIWEKHPWTLGRLDFQTEQFSESVTVEK